MPNATRETPGLRSLTLAITLTLATALTLAAAAACADSGSGPMTTESGLEYEMLREGDGPMPMADDRVRIHYRGMLTDSTQFDSSYDRGLPAEFDVDGVITGFGEALQLMSVGGHIRVTVPPELAYGERGAGDLIGPNETLIFEIELLEIIES